MIVSIIVSNAHTCHAPRCKVSKCGDTSTSGCLFLVLTLGGDVQTRTCTHMDARQMRSAEHQRRHEALRQDQLRKQQLVDAQVPLVWWLLVCLPAPCVFRVCRVVC